MAIFPNDDAIVRLVGALLVEQSENGRTRRYMSRESLGRVIKSERCTDKIEGNVA